MFLSVSFSCEVPILLRREQLQAPFRSGEDGDEEEGDEPVLKKPAARGKAPRAKGKAKAKAKTRAKAKAKQMARPKASPAKSSRSGAKAKASPKRKGRGGQAKADAVVQAPAKKGKVEGGISKKTFAGRYVKGPHLMAMRDVFEEKIYPKLHCHSSFQNSFFKLVTTALAEAQREDKEMDYDACLEIVNGQVDDFLKLEEVRNLASQSRVKKLAAFVSKPL